jgi:hypothetical protein
MDQESIHYLSRGSTITQVRMVAYQITWVVFGSSRFLLFQNSTWAMLLIGFAGIGFMAYRRKSNGPALRLA